MKIPCDTSPSIPTPFANTVLLILPKPLAEMMKVPGERKAWRKSSYSTAEETCVELARGLSALRDSKNPGGPVLTGTVAGLVAAVKADRLTR